MIWPILAAILASLSFSIRMTQVKNLRTAGFSSRALLGVFGATAPVWIVLALIYYFVDTIHVTSAIVLWMIAWVFLSIGSSWIRYYIVHYQSLSENHTYSKMYTMATILLADILIFDEALRWNTALAIALAYWAGNIFNKQKTEEAKARQKEQCPLLKIHLSLFVMAVLVAFQLICYKKGLLLLGNPVEYALLIQALKQVVNLLFGGYLAYSMVKASPGSVKTVVIIGLLTLSGGTLEAFAYHELPLIIVYLTGVLAVGIFGFYDKVNNEMVWGRKTWMGFVGLIASIVAASWHGF